jgi:hypothetical protein
MTQEPTTPRGARERVSVAGSGEPQYLVDNTVAVGQKQTKRVVAFLEKVTGGKVKLMKTEYGMRDTRYILSLNALEFRDALDAAVRTELRVPWSIEYSPTKGVRQNPNVLENGRLQEGFPTLVLVRRGLYVPKTRACTMVLSVVGIVIVFVLSLRFLYWILFILPTSAN